MGAYGYKQIIVEGPIDFEQIDQLRFSIYPNEHATLLITGIVSETKLPYLQSIALDSTVKFFLANEQGEKENIAVFAGVLTDIQCQYKEGVATVTAQVTSGSILLDRTKESRSYQDTTKTYSDIIKEAIDDIKQSAVICNDGRRIVAGKPIIQYAETDWQFAKRLASNMNSFVYPNIQEPRPWIWVGRPSKRGKATINPVKSSWGISKRYYDLGGEAAGYKKSDFKYYKVICYENLDIGCDVTYKQSSWYICEKHGEMVNGLLEFTYIIGKKALATIDPNHNSYFAGMTLLGKVLEVSGETLKLHLNIDESQDVGTAYPFEWVPDTGSVMYLMPKVGTTVSLYFSNEQESSGKVVNCIRENGSSCAGLSNPDNRALTTEHGKQLYIKPDTLGLVSDQTNDTIGIEDDNGITLKTTQMLQIIADGKVSGKGNKIEIETPTELKLIRN